MLNLNIVNSDVVVHVQEGDLEKMRKRMDADKRRHEHLKRSYERWENEAKRYQGAN